MTPEFTQSKYHTTYKIERNQVASYTLTQGLGIGTGGAVARAGAKSNRLCTNTRRH